MDEFWYSPGNGNDSNDGLSPATPKLTYQAVLDLTSATPDFTVINMGNSGTETISSQLFFTNGAGSKWTYSKRLVHRPWDEGVNGVHYRTVNGIQIPEWRWTASTGVNTDIFAAGEQPNYVVWNGGRVIGDGTQTFLTYGAFNGGSYGTIINCIAQDCQGNYAISGSTGTTIENCAVINTDGTSFPTTGFYTLAPGYVARCLVDGAKGYGINSPVVRNTVIKDWGRLSPTTYTALQAQCIDVMNCAIIGNWNGATGNARRGYDSSTYQPIRIFNNILTDLEKGFDFNASFDTAASFMGANAFHNVTTHYRRDNPAGSGYDLNNATMFDFTRLDLTLTENPFVDPDNDDYHLKSTSECRGRGLVLPFDYAGYLNSEGEIVSTPQVVTDIGPIPYGAPNLPQAGRFI